MAAVRHLKFLKYAHLTFHMVYSYNVGLCARITKTANIAKDDVTYATQ